jgi:hypothetical protein
MRAGERELRLHLIGSDDVAIGRAALVIDRLASGRVVSGTSPEWLVTYAGVDTGEAMRLLETDLTEIDPGWIEVLDFEAVPSQPLSEAEFS